MSTAQRKKKKRGHWPQGKSRNATTEAQRRRASAVIQRLNRILPDMPTKDEPSRSKIARRLGVDQRTVRRWLAGEDWPPARMVWRLERMVARYERLNSTSC